MTYVIVGLLSAVQVFLWIGWFICEIIVHSLNRDVTAGSYQQMLAEQSMQIYQYNGVIMAGTLAALHLAASVKTRAARVASFTVQAFSFLAWFWELYFVIPTFRNESNPDNLFCASFAFNQSLTPETSICRLARAIAAFAVAMQAVQAIIVLYSFGQIFIAPRLEDGTRKEIIEEDDAEVATVVAANPAGYESINRNVNTLSSLNLLLVLLSLTGYAIFMYSLIAVVKQNGFNVYANITQFGTANLIQLGDFVLSVNFRQLSLTLVFALAASSYAAFRHNRGIQAGALFLTVMTALQWWSLIIYSGRYLHQWHNNQLPAGAAQLPAANYYNDYPYLSAQRAMFAGACIILAGETLRIFTLLARYMAFVPVTRNGVIPTYIRGAFATANPVPVMLFWFECCVTFAWWVLQFVSESMSGIWNDVPLYSVTGAGTVPYTVALQTVVSDTLFIWQTMYILAVFLPELFSERTKTLASKQAALSVNIVIMCAWFLLSWPWAYAGSHRDGGYWESGSVYPLSEGGIIPNPGVNTFGFCLLSLDNAGHDNCGLMQGASILAFISGAGYVLLALYQVARIITMLPTPGQVATIDGAVVDALPPTVPIQRALGWNSALLLCGLLIWALTAIDVGSGYYGWLAWTFGQLPSTPGWQTLFYTPLNSWQTMLSYTYSVAFGDLVIIGFTVWAAAEMSSNPVVANWHAWRTMVTGLSALLFSFFIPQFIQVCRFLNWGHLSVDATAVGAGFIIMCCGDFLLYACALAAQRSPLIALPAAINNTAAPVVKNQPTQMQQVTVDKPIGATSAGGVVVGPPTTTSGVVMSGYAPSEPTVVTNMNNGDPVPTREYSGRQENV